jgi:hypothetical protein
MRRLFTAAALLVLSAGCTQGFPDSPVGGGGTIGGGGSSPSFAGTYTLRTVNGLPVPYTYLTSGADTYVLVSDVVTLTAAGGWTEQWNETHTVGGVVTTPSFQDAGTYTVSGTAIAFTSTTAGSPQPYFQGTVGANQLTLPGQGIPGGPVETMIYTE